MGARFRNPNVVIPTWPSRRAIAYSRTAERIFQDLCAVVKLLLHCASSLSLVLPPLLSILVSMKTFLVFPIGSKRCLTWVSWVHYRQPSWVPSHGNWSPVHSPSHSYPTRLYTSFFKLPCSLKPSDLPPLHGCCLWFKARLWDSNSMKSMSVPPRNVPPKDTPMTQKLTKVMLVLSSSLTTLVNVT